MAVATAVIMVGVVVVAVGRGGEIAYFTSDYAPLDLGVVAATDVVLLRPPTSIWGYNIQVTDEALGRITQALNQRDIRIAALEQQVADLRAERDLGAGRDMRTAGQAGPGAATDPRAARWEARGTGWEAAAGTGPGIEGLTRRGPVPVTRPQPAAGGEGVAGQGAPSPGAPAERLRAQAAETGNASGQQDGRAEPGADEDGAGD